MAPAPFALQGLGPRLRLELPHPAAAARRVLDPLRRRPRHAAAHRDGGAVVRGLPLRRPPAVDDAEEEDRKSTRLNSSHSQISYAVFCLKKKNHASRLTQFL